MRSRRRLTSRATTLALLLLPAAAPAFRAIGAIEPTPPATRPARELLLAPTTVPATQPSAAEIDALIARLTAPGFGQRQAAQDKLVAFGDAPEVLERLREVAASAGTDAETVSRARTALRQIEEGRKVGPTLVTLHMDGATPEEVLRELARRTGVMLPADPPDLWSQHEWRRISVHADRQPFWTVLRRFCHDTGLTIEGSRLGPLAVQPGAGTWAEAPSVVSGAFLVQAAEVTRTRTVNFAQPNNIEQTCELSLHVYLEPKLRVLRDAATARFDRVLDDRGNSLLASGPDAAEPTLSPMGDGTHQWDLSVALNYPKDAGRTIAELGGTLNFLMPVRTDLAEVADVLGAKLTLRTVAGRRFLFRRCRKTGANYEVQLTVYRDALADDAWQQMVSPQEFVRLVDAADRPLPFSGMGESSGSEKEMTIALQFEAPQPVAGGNPAAGIGAGAGPTPGKPARFIWELPTEIKELRVPFHFGGLPLP